MHCPKQFVILKLDLPVLGSLDPLNIIVCSIPDYSLKCWTQDLFWTGMSPRLADNTFEHSDNNKNPVNIN